MAFLLILFVFSTMLFLFIMLFISHSWDKFPELNDNYYFEHSPMHDISLLDSNNKVIIYGHIVNYDYNETYFIAAEKPREVIFKEYYDINNINNHIPSKLTYKEREKKFEESRFYHLWIINLKTDSVFGPLSIEEFKEKRVELQVPDSLKLTIEIEL